MRSLLTALLFSLLPLPLLAQDLLPSPQNANIILSNDDGWAELNIRMLFDSLVNAGNSVVLSAPADNKSGTGPSDAPATPLTEPCQYDSCPAGSPAYGFNASSPRLNYVNSFPVTAIRYGIQTLAPRFFGGDLPDLAVTGFNNGANLERTIFRSGTVGAALDATSEFNIPSIAFSGTSGSPTAYTTAPIPHYAYIYTTLATKLTTTLLNSGKPYLPWGTFLNVNFPAVSTDRCSSAGDFVFVLSRLNTMGFGVQPDAYTCGERSLPTESEVVGNDGGCYVSVSLGSSTQTRDEPGFVQEDVVKRLSGLLGCLPKDGRGWE
ncbi:MAG: hypothetical protein Q9208_003255 [Pyrenodesmia sp. 3 TL-2023]